jgi:hypothetical protein
MITIRYVEFARCVFRWRAFTKTYGQKMDMQTNAKNAGQNIIKNTIPVMLPK